MERADFNKDKIIKYWIYSSDDDYTMSFQKTCTPEFSATWLEKIKTNRLWIKALLEV